MRDICFRPAMRAAIAFIWTHEARRRQQLCGIDAPRRPGISRRDGTGLARRRRIISGYFFGIQCCRPSFMIYYTPTAPADRHLTLACYRCLRQLDILPASYLPSSPGPMLTLMVAPMSPRHKPLPPSYQAWTASAYRRAHVTHSGHYSRSRHISHFYAISPASPR